MAIIKCKMCGGDLNLNEGASTAECEFCGSVQTIPNLDDEKKLIQFERAERLRKQCEFDKAAGIYETILADFRQEAEAYWGLVLCKYGIEYVDDPATGKKIPTCHRSSFDSIMEDSDFEQALENADSVARKVYREEAKGIEEIRKGIISVSSNEQPYDIFICYKETSETGDRTLDSVLAQDVFDALTDKGYQVFFSRISLEDKLGMEYEPYIFAALNSAKIMLAFGTDYEYFNAVWVKNEWSRFLKLMAKNKDKHLIPCFKGIDAYDMPKEFARLQAQDLGKVGAIQDLLRGIEKIIPRQAAQPTIVQERVVVGSSGDNKITSLLDRGNMALEDGDWAKADSFFEDVLNNDSKNAQAYLGKTLAMERCRTIDAFARKRKDASQNVRGEKLELQPNHTHINKMLERFSLPGYVEQDEIRKLYHFDLSYHSNTAERLQQYRNEEDYWKNHKQLSRAEKFAVGAVAENLQREKTALFYVLTDRAKKAKAEEEIAKKEVQTRYEAHLRCADEQAEKRYNEGIARREKYYQDLLQIAKTSSNVEELTETAKKFEKLGDYKDSKNLAEHCRKRATEEQAALDAEAERHRLLKEKQEKERWAKIKRKIIIACSIASAVILCMVFVYLLNTVIIPTSKYNDALARMEAGNYKTAIEIFADLRGYKDSTAKIAECEVAIKEDIYQQALLLMANQQYKEAYELLDAIAGYKDADDQTTEARYQEGLQYWNKKEYETSNRIFADLGSYKDSANLIHYHEYTSIVEKEPQCEEDGTMSYNCTDCAHSYTMSIAATGHAFGEEIVKEPGCETTGTMKLTCACGHTEEEEIAATGHDYSNSKVESPATCTSTGVLRYSCHCGKTSTAEIEKTAHVYSGKVTTAATCMADGVKTYTCTGCGDGYTEKIAATGHSYDNGKATTAAGCESKGVKTYTCANCKYTYTESLAALGHSYAAATCTAGGKCSRCDAVSKPLGHTTTTETCDRCNYNFTPKQTITGGFAMLGKSVDLKLSKGRYSAKVIIENASKYESCYVSLYYSTSSSKLVNLYREDQRTDGTYYFEFTMDETISDFTIRADRYGLTWTFIIEPINET